MCFVLTSGGCASCVQTATVIASLGTGDYFGEDSVTVARDADASRRRGTLHAGVDYVRAFPGALFAVGTVAHYACRVMGAINLRLRVSPQLARAGPA